MFFNLFILISSKVYRWYNIMVTDRVVSEHCVTMYKKGKMFQISFSNISMTLKGFQELELLLNSICRGLRTCILSLK